MFVRKRLAGWEKQREKETLKKRDRETNRVIKRESVIENELERLQMKKVEKVRSKWGSHREKERDNERETLRKKVQSFQTESCN